jgi:hypothetical protein
MYRLFGGLGVSEQAPVRAALTSYATSAVADDWPAMENGGESPKTLDALNMLYGAVLAVPAPDERSAVLFEGLLSQLNVITESRRIRLHLAEGVVPNVIWLVLFTGAFMTLGFTFFFGLRNAVVQLLMTGMLAIVIFLALFVAVIIDHPFTGTVRVSPDALELVVNDFGSPP